MNQNLYAENQLVEQPAIALFEDLGWQVAFLDAPPPAFSGVKSAVVMYPRLTAALEKLNPGLPFEAIVAAVDDLTRDRSAMLVEQANREVYLLLKEGIRVSVADEGSESTPHPSPLPVRGGEGMTNTSSGLRPLSPESGEGRGGQKIVRVRVIDWEHPTNNDFLLVSQFSVTGALYTCRPDLVGFVNGLPLVVIELKKPGVPARVAFDDNLNSYKHPQNGIPALFVYNAFMIASNGTESRVGSLTADWGRFFEWKRIAQEDEPRRVSLEVMIRGTCDKARLLDLIENFTLFSEHKAGLVKIIGQNHQFLGVNNAISSMLEARKRGHGRGGVFWQTQGSGKSFSMVFFAQKVLRKLPGNWTFVVITDRVELDDQIAKTFKACGAVTEAEGNTCHAQSGAQLRELLKGNHRYVFTLVHKFQTNEVLSERSDVIVLTDEAHRSQYDTLAVNMRSALKNATFLAFTGTPLIASEERTREVFGDYVSIYDFQQAVEDGATVPLYYENRTPELGLQNPDLNEHIYKAIESAELDEEQEKKLERELGRQYHLITRDERLETVSKDVVRHFLGRGFPGKAMVIAIDKATAVRMYDKVRKHWATELKKVEKDIATLGVYPDLENAPKRKKSEPAPIHYDADRLKELQARLAVLKNTDMAVIVSPAQNEIEQMKKLGLDIIPHRERMQKEELDEKFKDPKDPLSLVFVCAMWLTGFDAPSCSTVYLDKPMRNHTLMQTIARANRVFPGKHSGLIVDYCNVFASLEKALAIYGKGGGGETPVRDKQELIDDLRRALSQAVAFCALQKVSIQAIENCQDGMKRIELLGDAVDRLISPDPLRKDFLAHDALVGALYNAIKPDPAVLEFASQVSCIATIADMIRLRLTGDKPPDISGVMAEINRVLDESITADGFVIQETAGGKPLPRIDLSKINFEALAKRFAKSKRKNLELETLKAAVAAQLNKVILLNKTQTNYLLKFEELIDSYNNGSRNIEELFEELLKLSRSLSSEQSRHVRENITQEELVILDILTRPAPELTAEERAEVKKVARELLTKLKQLLVLNWRQKSSATSQVKLAIEDVLDTGLPRAYDKPLYEQKCTALFEHIFESYPERDAWVFAEVS